MSNLERVASLLSDLVARESVNPTLPGGQRGEIAVADYVSAFCERLGLEVERQEVFPNRPNVIARLHAPRGRGALLLEAHTDTVPAGDMSDAFTPEVEDGRLYGRGACDTKGSLAAMLHAIEQLVQKADTLPCDVILLAAISEEDGSFGAEAFLDLGIEVDGAVVGEPTDLRLVTAYKGVVRFRITTQGRAGHTSTPVPEENAIYQAVEVVRALRTYADRLSTSQMHPLVGPATLTVSRFHGGEVINVVPATCDIDIDRRTLPNEVPEEVLADVDQLLAELMDQEPWITARRTETIQIARGMETVQGHPLLVALQRACLDAGLPTETQGVPYGTDASMLAGKGGIPSIVFGPGRISEAHSSREWVSLAQVAQASDILVRAVQHFQPRSD
ncbi:MAG: M20 family metallopeptidase [Chloroflexota bacterium]|nr:M20 family metallopeptidase [Chloroflexota bacterium]